MSQAEILRRRSKIRVTLVVRQGRRPSAFVAQNQPWPDSSWFCAMGSASVLRSSTLATDLFILQTIGRIQSVKEKRWRRRSLFTGRRRRTRDDLVRERSQQRPTNCHRRIAQSTCQNVATAGRATLCVDEACSTALQRYRSSAVAQLGVSDARGSFVPACLKPPLQPIPFSLNKRVRALSSLQRHPYQS